MSLSSICFSDLNKPAPPQAWPKKCACGRSYSFTEWKRLPLVGTHDDGVDVIEMRNCVCRSTISINVGPSPNRKPTCAHCSQPIDGVRVCADEGAMHLDCARARYEDDVRVFQHPAAIFTSWVRTNDPRWLAGWRQFRRAFYG